MKLDSRSWALVAGCALVAAAGVFALSQAGFFSTPDPSSLWSWSLDNWETTAVGASGERFRVAHEPLALARNLALISVAFIGVVLGTPRVVEIVTRSGRGGGAVAGGAPEDFAKTRRLIDGELGTILTLVRSHLDSNKTYSAALVKGHKELTTTTSPDQIRAAIVLLIAENQKMLRETEEHQRRLEDSQRQITELRAELAETQELNVRDSLTQVFTRRHFDDTLAREAKIAASSASSLSLIMADIDHFKKINDGHGHLIGDEVLKNFARTMTKHVEEKDTVARYGGEEFAIIMPAVSFAEAKMAAERIRAEFENKKWAIKGGAPIGRITASFGVAQLAPHENAESLIQRADAKLYVSKSRGRNLVTVDADLSPR
ncbi:diguanylate cyclase [Methylosinus sp. sav-2]|jgi:diguanylate cyclase|uniref:GGDEF domain-containing protein n=1 Tax=unclassified Methylosinus TaxID=2624500 RepID=UPI00047C6F05|nr:MULTISPECIES: GGDEF domain-containing protein [unclassified Methylosinus]TDX64716.1 diguanylate cyclase [Methylosinus sp. sav-2]